MILTASAGRHCEDLAVDVVEISAEQNLYRALAINQMGGRGWTGSYAGDIVVQGSGLNGGNEEADGSDEEGCGLHFVRDKCGK